MTNFTNNQRDRARDELIGAFEGYSSSHGVMYQSHGVYLIDQQERRVLVKALKDQGYSINHLKQSKQGNQSLKATQIMSWASKPLVNDKALQQSWLLEMIEVVTRHDPIASKWVELAYLGQDSEPILQELEALYALRFKVRKGTESKIKIMLTLLVNQSLAIALDRLPLSDSKVAQLMGIDKKSYRESWKHKFDWLVKLMSVKDSGILDSVCFFLGYKELDCSI